jgi:nucleotidyltransferase/DNA polymerase involved in DNA repair
MRVAAVCVPHFPSLVESSRQPSLRDHPLLITDSDQPKIIIDCSAVADAQGVRIGMAFRQAVSRSPDATVLTADPRWYADAWGTVLDALEDVSPQVEDAGLGRAFLDVDGLGPHYRDDLDLGETIINAVRHTLDLIASIGLARGKFPALAAAVVNPAGTIMAIPRGREREFLAPLDVSLLPATGDVHDRLTRLWGLHSIGEVAALPRGGLLNQLGKVGERLWLLANGIDNEPLLARRHHRVIEDTLSFDGVVGTVDVLLIAGQQMISRLHGQLGGRAAREMRM